MHVVRVHAALYGMMVHVVRSDVLSPAPQNTKEERRLFSACEEGGIEVVKELLNAGNKDAHDYAFFECTPLHHAAR